jgi:hypothetical protein
MNCCDANGKCKGGHGCPIADDLPIQMAEPDPEPMALHWGEWIMIASVAAALMGIGFVFGRYV